MASQRNRRELTRLRVQNCVMLARAPDFDSQCSPQGSLRPLCCRRSTDARRGSSPLGSSSAMLGNERCPCLRSDPQFPDCPRGDRAGRADGSPSSKARISRGSSSAVESMQSR